jgi:hypothetical protein
MILWNIFLNSLTLILVAIVVSKTDRAFEAAAVILGMIAFLRLESSIERKHHLNSILVARQEIWFRRLEFLINKQPETHPETLQLLRSLDEEGPAEHSERALKARASLETELWIHSTTEIILIIALLWILLRS